MGRMLIVSNIDNLFQYEKLANQYNLGFEFNDFFDPKVLIDRSLQDEIISKYKKIHLPEYCTMHGAFMDVLLFSFDDDIRKIARDRMKESMEIARRVGAKAVVFHTNANPFLNFGDYNERMVFFTAEYIEKLLNEYKDINIYLENMFDNSPDILHDISEKLSVYDNYGVCFDYAHASISNTELDEWIESLRKYIKHIHINDNDLINDLHLAVGDGAIDWDIFFDYYKKYFYDCSLLIETTKPENQRKSIEFLKKWKLF